jgi:hypothetical protein
MNRLGRRTYLLQNNRNNISILGLFKHMFPRVGKCGSMTPRTAYYVRTMFPQKARRSEYIQKYERCDSTSGRETRFRLGSAET